MNSDKNTTSMSKTINVDSNTVIDFNFTKELMYDVEAYLYNNPKTKYLSGELTIKDDHTFGILIENGDWKHEHICLDNIVGEYLTSMGLEVESYTQEVGHSDSDCYSAWHYYSIKKSSPMEYDVEGDDADAAKGAQDTANRLFTPVKCRGIVYYPQLKLTEALSNGILDETAYKSGDRYYGGLPAEPDYKGPGKSARYYKELINYFKDVVSDYFEYDIIGTSPTTIILKTPDGREEINLCKFDACADAEEAVEMASHYFDESLFEARNKKKNGALVNPDAGNVEHNLEMFNKMNSPVEGPCNNPVSGPFGGDVGGGEAVGESMNESTPESLRYQFLDEIYEYDELMDIIFSVRDTADFVGKSKSELINFILDNWDMWDFQEEFEAWEDSLNENVVNEVRDSTGETHESERWILVKSKKWYDPEGLGIEPEGTILCSGTEDECRDKFSDIVVKARKEDKLYREDGARNHHAPFMQIDKLDKYSLVISYPLAQAKDVYQLINKTSSSSYEPKVEESLTEAAPKKETIELEYKDLEFTQCGNQRDADDWDEWDRCMDWTYEVSKYDLYVFIFESCIEEEDFPEAFQDNFDPNNATDWSKFSTWLDNNFDTIYKKYEDKILANWEEAARQAAIEDYNPDDYIDWDSMPGGYDERMTPDLY